MKSIFALFALLTFNSAFGADAVWSTTGTHPLWEVLDVEIVYSKGMPSYEVKEVAGVTCTKSGEDYTCVFPENMKPDQLRALYKAIKTAPTDTNGAYTEYKIVDKMILMGTQEENSEFSNYDDMFVLHLDHPCQSVQNKKEANACMDFWSTEVLPSFNESNDVEVVVANKKNKETALKVIGWVHGDYPLFNERMQNADFIGIMNEHMDEDHLYYFAIQKGKNVVPLESLDLNVADIAYTFESALKDSPDKTAEGFFKFFASQLVLGFKDVGHFVEMAEEAFDYWVEEDEGAELFAKP